MPSELLYEPENTWHEYCLEMNPKVIEAAITEEWLTSNDLEIHLDIYGKEDDLQTTIIFIHGTAVYSRFYVEPLYSLYQEGYRVVAVDLPGHGISEGKRGHFDMKLLTSVIYDVTTYVINNFGENVAVMGSSLGGFTSLYCVANDDRIKAAVCHNAALLNEGAHKKIVKVGLGYRILKPAVPVLAKIFPTLRISVWVYLDPAHLFADEKLLAKMDVVMADRLVSDRYTLKALATQLRAAPARPVEEIETPIMIINSDQDVLFSVEYMEEIFDRLENSRNKRLEIIKDAAHLILHEKREESIGKIVKWLKSVI